MDESTALLATLAVTPPHAPTACVGWTAHELVAHLAAGAAEMADLVEAAVGGGPERPTRAFGEREAPYVALDDEELRGRLVTEALRLQAAVQALGSERAVAFSGRRLAASDLSMHGRSEAALHRWDLVGDDATSRELLAQPELTAHAVTVLNSMVNGSSEAVAHRVMGTEHARLAFGSPGLPDVVLVVDDDGARLESDDPSPTPVAVADPATRLLALWGRRSSVGTVRWVGEDASCDGLARFLWPATSMSDSRQT